MNQNCPSCGALYNVAEKDIGRKLKCKKCSAGLKVTDEGLVVDGTASSPPISDPKPAASSLGADDDGGDDEPVVKKKKKDRVSGPGFDPSAALAGIGGISTIIFGFGVFLVILFIALPLIGAQGTERAKAYKDKLVNEQAREKFELKPKKKQSDWTDAEKKKIEEDSAKIDEKYARLIEEAGLDAESTRVSNVRSVWMEQYGLMFGFMFVAFGCIGYLRTEQPLVVKIVAGTILTFMMMILFMKFGGCNMR